MNITDTFIDHLYFLANTPMPDHVLEQAGLCAMDYVGCAAAGAKMMADRNEGLLNAVRLQGGGSSVIGTAYKTTLHKILRLPLDIFLKFYLVLLVVINLLMYL